MTLAGQIILLSVDSFSTVGDVEAKLQASQSIPPDGWYLIFRGERFLDRHTLSHYDVKSGSVLLIASITEIKIFVVTIGDGLDTITLNVDMFSTTAGDVKAMIHSREGISPGEQRLIFNNEKLGDRSSLSTYKIREGDRLYLFLPFRI